MPKFTKNNFKSGITVGLVSIPLSISLALASGATPSMGILAAFWGGFVAALFAGSHFNIVGPTGALSGLILTFILTNGLTSAATLAFVAGIIILFAWALNLAKYIIYIPSSVIHGFTLGVAFIIGLGQINNALAIKPDEVHEQAILNVLESLEHISQAVPFSILIFVCGLAFLLFTKRYFPKFPAALVLVFSGIGLGILTNSGLVPLALPTLYTKFGTLSLNLFQFTLPKFNRLAPLFQGAAVIAFIAIVETLLSGKIADSMTKTKFKRKKEILALGLGNILSGLFGGIPVTAALARTSLNIKSGATHNTSAIVSSLTIGIISLVLFPYFQYLPLAIVAAILVNVAINMIEAEHFRELWRYDKLAFAICVIVGILTFTIDPILAVLLGAVVTLLMQIDRMSRGEYELFLNKNRKLKETIIGTKMRKVGKGYDPIVYSFSDNLTYINSQAHLSRLENLPNDTKNVVLRFRSVHYMDPDGIAAVAEIVEELSRKGKQVYITGLSDYLVHFCKDKPFFKSLEAQNHVLPKTQDALSVIYKGN